MKNKVNNILTSGNYNNKDDIYKKVFSEDELSQMQLNITQNENDENKELKDDDNKTNKSKISRKENKKKKKEHDEKNNEDTDLFVTQGNVK